MYLPRHYGSIPIIMRYFRKHSPPIALSRAGRQISVIKGCKVDLLLGPEDRARAGSANGRSRCIVSIY